MTRRRSAASVLASLLFAGCSVSTERAAHVADERSVPFQLLDEDAPPITRPPAAGDTRERVALCFVREGRLIEVARELRAPVSAEDTVAALATVPGDEATGARTALPDPLLVRGIRVLGGVARVDLAGRVAELAGQDQLLVVAQLVCTLTARPGVGQVSFDLEGAPIDVPRGDGSVVAGPVSRDDYSALLS